MPLELFEEEPLVSAEMREKIDKMVDAGEWEGEEGECLPSTPSCLTETSPPPTRREQVIITNRDDDDNPIGGWTARELMEHRGFSQSVYSRGSEAGAPVSREPQRSPTGKSRVSYHLRTKEYTIDEYRKVYVDERAQRKAAKENRASTKCSTPGALRPIPVPLFPTETSADYEAAFTEWVTRFGKTYPTTDDALRSRKITYAYARVSGKVTEAEARSAWAASRGYTSRPDPAPPVQEVIAAKRRKSASRRSSNARLGTASAAGSPSTRVAPVHEDTSLEYQECPPEEKTRAPKSSGSVETLSTSQGTRALTRGSGEQRAPEQSTALPLRCQSAPEGPVRAKDARYRPWCPCEGCQREWLDAAALCLDELWQQSAHCYERHSKRTEYSLALEETVAQNKRVSDIVAVEHGKELAALRKELSECQTALRAERDERIRMDAQLSMLLTGFGQRPVPGMMPYPAMGYPQGVMQQQHQAHFAQVPLVQPFVPRPGYGQQHAVPQSVGLTGASQGLGIHRSDPMSQVDFSRSQAELEREVAALEFPEPAGGPPGPNKA